jgi:hypothetical protein
VTHESLTRDRVLIGYAAAVVIFLLIWPFKDLALGGDHYLFLARSLVHGSLNVDNLPSYYADYVLAGGHKYLAFGPVPALLLIPFLPLLNAGLPMVWIGYALTALNIRLFYAILQLAGVTAERRYWATLLYFGGTVYLSIALVGISTYLAHIVVTTFLLLAIWETLRNGRAAVAGLHVGLAAGARLTAAFSLPFFLWLLWREFRELSARQVALLLLGFAIPVLLLFAYNYARFGTPTETGFGKTELYQPVLESARLSGLFSVAHIPKNLLMMLLQGPQAVGGENTPVLRFPYIEPSKWGMGLFFTSPALLYAFRARLSEPLVQACWAAILATLVPILTYYGIGYVQFGYRYALDFMPFLALLAARGLPDPMTTQARALVGASVLINVWGAGYLAAWL